MAAVGSQSCWRLLFYHGGSWRIRRLVENSRRAQTSTTARTAPTFDLALPALKRVVVA